MRRFIVLAAIVMGVLGLPAPAMAHLGLVDSAPAAGARLDVVPDTLRLAFTQAVELAFSRLTLTGPAGAVELDPAALEGASGMVLLAAVRGGMVAGPYILSWQAAGPDGHPIRGEIAFEIAPGAAGLLPPAAAAPLVDSASPAPPPAPRPAPAADAGGFGAESPLYVAIRWLGFIGMVAVIGAATFRLLLLRLAARADDPAGAELAGRAAPLTARAGRLAAAGLLAAVVLRLLAQMYAVNGGAMGGVLLHTIWGWGWLLQAAGATAALLGFWMASRGRGAGWTIASLGALAIALSSALSGHAAGAPRLAGVAITADTLHVLGAGGWIGGLLMVVVVGLPAALRQPGEQAGSAARSLIREFSPAALAFAALLVASGLLLAWIHLGSIPALWTSGYGRTLLIKLAFAAVVVGAGFLNWRRLRPALGPTAAAHRLRRSAAVELLAALLVLVVTAVLVSTPPPTHADSPTPPPAATAGLR